MSNPPRLRLAPGAPGRLDRSAALAKSIPDAFAGTVFDPADVRLAGAFSVCSESVLRTGSLPVPMQREISWWLATCQDNGERVVNTNDWRRWAATAAEVAASDPAACSFADLTLAEWMHFAAAQPAQHHRIDHGPVAVSPQRRPQRVDLGRRQHPRQRAGRADQRHPAPATPRTRPAGSQAARHRVAAHAGVLPGAQVRIQAPHARQPPGDRPCRQARLAILQPHHPPAMPGSTLSRQEPEHVRSRHLRRRLGHHPEEDLQIKGHRQPGVGPGPGSHERQVVIHQRMPEPDHRDAAVLRRADQAWHELQQVTPSQSGSTPRHASMSLPLDHPHIKHRSPEMTMRYAATLATTAEREFLAMVKIGRDGRQVGIDRRDMLDLLQLDRRTDRILPNGYCLLPPVRSCDKGNACFSAAIISRPTAAISPRSAGSSPPPSSSSGSGRNSTPPATASR